MFRLLSRFGGDRPADYKNDKMPRSTNAMAVRDPQYIPAADGDGLWLDGPPKGSPEHRQFVRWLSS